MKPIALIIRRELSAYLRSPLGWVVAAVVLLMDGLLFNSFALGSDTARKSSEILRQFFYFSSGTTMAASLFLSMRLIAEERQNGTLTLLFTSPIRDYQIVIGKFLSALIFLAALTLLTGYMPALILVVASSLFLKSISVGMLRILYLFGTSRFSSTFILAICRRSS